MQITQDYINGYVSALNTLRLMFTNELKSASQEQSLIIHGHIKAIDSIKESYKELIKNLNNNNKLTK